MTVADTHPLVCRGVGAGRSPGGRQSLRAQSRPAGTGQSGEVKTAQGHVKSQHVVLGCNAYLGKLIPRLAGNIMPINNFVIATEPLPLSVAAD